MKALILAAGYGTRMYPLTKLRPKSFLEIKHKPLIDYLVKDLDSINKIDKIIIVTNNKFFHIFLKWSKKIDTKKRIVVLNDGTRYPSQRLGAIGDINFVIKQQKLNDDLLVLGGDNLFDQKLDEFIKFCFHKRPHPCLGVYNVKKKELAKRYGVVKLDKHSKVNKFAEKSNNPFSTLAAMCLYFFPKEKLHLFREYLKINRNHIDLAGLYIDWLCKKEKVFGFEFKGNWFDIGQHDSYKKANLIFKKSA